MHLAACVPSLRISFFALVVHSTFSSVRGGHQIRQANPTLMALNPVSTPSSRCSPTGVDKRNGLGRSWMRQFTSRPGQLRHTIPRSVARSHTCVGDSHGSAPRLPLTGSEHPAQMRACCYVMCIDRSQLIPLPWEQIRQPCKCGRDKSDALSPIMYLSAPLTRGLSCTPFAFDVCVPESPTLRVGAAYAFHAAWPVSQVP